MILLWLPFVRGAAAISGAACTEQIVESSQCARSLPMPACPVTQENRAENRLIEKSQCRRFRGLEILLNRLRPLDSQIVGISRGECRRYEQCRGYCEEAHFKG